MMELAAAASCAMVTEPGMEAGGEHACSLPRRPRQWRCWQWGQGTVRIRHQIQSGKNHVRMLRTEDYGFCRLLSMIRFGFRPYFIEKNSREPCPHRCRCYIKQKFAHEFCTLPSAGCDMRSSDFYIIHKKSYAPLLSKIVDIRQANSKRIIDTAPMRSLANQWLILPLASIQTKLDIPVDYQIGLSAVYVKKCVMPRPVPRIVSQQFVNTSVQYTLDI